MFLGLTAASFAQATFNVGSIPVTAVINTGQTEQTGDITFTQINNGIATVQGTITITYPGTPITVPLSPTNPVPPSVAGFGPRIINPLGTGLVLSGVNPPAVAGSNVLSILSVSSGCTTGTGQVVIGIPGGLTDLSFTLTGVRVSIASAPTLTNQVALISTTNNAITAGQTSVVVISSIAPGIAKVQTKSSQTGSINAVAGTVTTQPTINVTEGFLNAFGDPTIATEAGIRITLSGVPPAGVTITFPATASTSAALWETMNADGTILNQAVTINSSTTNPVVYYREVSPNDPTTQEVLVINPTLSVSSSATLPLPSTSITYTVSLAPIGAAFDTSGGGCAVIAPVPASGPILFANIPRYAAAEVGPQTLLNITGLNTVLLVPFAQTVTALGYNTGLAIANTTEDPGASAMGFASGTAATPQNGTIKFYFFPTLPSPTGTNPTNFTYTTMAGSPGNGLDANGNLVAGATYTVLLSQLLAAANQPADFNGYIFIITNFTNAHGFWTISNFTTFSQGGALLVVPGPRNITGENLNN